jgi:hypothetical protein
MDEKPLSVFIATPMYGGMCHGSYAKSMFNTMKTLLDNGINVEFRDVYNESVVSRARDILTALFLKSECDYLLFMDADQSFRPDDVLRMLSEDLPLLGAVVPKKEINWPVIEWAVKEKDAPWQALPSLSGSFNIPLPKDGPEPDFSKPFEVTHVGTGMMLIKREVFEEMKNHVESYKFFSSGVLGLDAEDEVWNFWNPRVFDGQWCSEDVSFCRLWTRAGNPVYAVAYPKVAHIGSYEFTGSLTQ